MGKIIMIVIGYILFSLSGVFEHLNTFSTELLKEQSRIYVQGGFSGGHYIFTLSTGKVQDCFAYFLLCHWHLCSLKVHKTSFCLLQGI